MGTTNQFWITTSSLVGRGPNAWAKYQELDLLQLAYNYVMELTKLLAKSIQKVK